MDTSTLLARIEQHLTGGLATDWAARAYTDDAIHAAREHLSSLDPNDLEGRLVVAGFTLVPHVPNGDADDIGLAALYLCSDRCYASGAVLNIDGGLYQPIAQ